MNVFSAIFSNTIVAFIILIGVVVLVHELGHFLVAKFFGIQVEEFAIGFGPCAFSFKKGSTEYNINWLPLGGYVRLFGADNSENIPLALQSQSISHAHVTKRALVAFAGPFANFILSFFIMLIIFIHGIPSQPTKVFVLANSVAEQSGLQTGDNILFINHEKIRDWTMLVDKISEAPNKNISLVIERQNTEHSILLTPKNELVDSLFNGKKNMGRIGVSPIFPSSTIFTRPNDFLSLLTLVNGDRIVSVNKKYTQFLFQVAQELEKATGAHGEQELARTILSNPLSLKTLSLNILGLDKKTRALKLNFNHPTVIQWAKSTQNLPHISWQKSLISSDQTISAISNTTTQETTSTSVNAWTNCSLQAGDTFYKFGDSKVLTSVSQIYIWLADLSNKLTTTHVLSGTKIPIAIEVFSKSGKLKKLNCQIPAKQTQDMLYRPIITIDFPIQFLSSPELMPNIIIKTQSFSDLFNLAFSALWRQTLMIYNGIKMLFSGALPLANLGGPIAIAGIASSAAKAGYLSFLMMMSAISVNIAMFNLLPFPALDGGNILLCIVEATYGKALPKVIQTFVQRLGLFILLALIILVFYNDILRLLK